MKGAQAAILGSGDRLHLHHGPIDLIIGAQQRGRERAFAAAFERFKTILEELVEHLEQHRSQLTTQTALPSNPVAQRMYEAAGRHALQTFVTPMIAVAGAVADEVLAAMLEVGPLRRAYVNNGGDIAVHLEDSAEFSLAMALTDGADLGRVRICGSDGIGGIATSGTRGRSHSFGIADSVTVLAARAAEADAAATLIANAVDLPGRPDIVRRPARELQPDSDLGNRPVVTGVPILGRADCETALRAGRRVAENMLDSGLIKGAALFLQNQNITLGHGFDGRQQRMEFANA